VLKHLTRTEPDPALFQLENEYKIVSENVPCVDGAEADSALANSPASQAKLRLPVKVD
jgi:hypothetical protein